MLNEPEVDYFYWLRVSGVTLLCLFFLSLSATVAVDAFLMPLPPSCIVSTEHCCCMKNWHISYSFVCLHLKLKFKLCASGV